MAATSSGGRGALEERLLDLRDQARTARASRRCTLRGKVTWWMSGTSGEKPRRWTSFEPDSDIAP